MNTTNTNTDNGVNGRVSPANSVAPGRFSPENQAKAGRHHASGDEQNAHQKENRGRKKYMRNDNIRLMKCYFLAKSNPKMGYMKRMLRIWRERRLGNDVDSQRLSDQVRAIRRNGLRSELKIEVIKRKVTETSNEEAQVRENTEKESVGSENIELVQGDAWTACETN